MFSNKFFKSNKIYMLKFCYRVSELFKLVTTVIDGDGVFLAH